MDMLYYKNENTNEWTDNHREAVQWFNNGNNVELDRIDTSTGELFKCAEWVWQKDKCPPGGDMKTSSPGGHFRQIAQYISHGQCARGMKYPLGTHKCLQRAGRLDFGHFMTQIEPIFILQLLSAKSANMRSIRIIPSRFPKSSYILRKDTCLPPVDAIAALFCIK